MVNGSAGDSGANLVDAFVATTGATPEGVALVVGGESVTYEGLGGRAEALGRLLEAEKGESRLVGLLAARSVTAYAGILGALSRGLGYVPLNPAFPAARNAKMVSAAEPDLVLVGAEGLGTLRSILPLVDRPTRFLVVGAEPNALDGLAAGVHGVEPVESPPEGSAALSADRVAPDTIAYVLFTSGSTGEPKGVMVTHANVVAYVDYIAEAFDFGPADRFSQNFDLTFDLSVHDMFVAYRCGAAIHCPTTAETKLPSKFIKEHELTVWFCVPSVASVMSRLRMARPDMYPSLRMSLFCGEGLPLATAKTWQAAAPNSTLVNLYGPTEATIAITRFDVSPDLDEDGCHGGVVPIGTAFPEQATAVVGEDGRPVERGEQGELCLGGSQITLGYWRNETKTAEQFVLLPEVGAGRWYRTGDLVYEDDDGVLQYLGRIDHQVKIMGYRVELQEIEHQLRELAGFDSVAAVAWPVDAGIAQGIEAFIAGAGEGHMEATEVIERCRADLPVYMVPKGVHFVDDFPLNSNGKLDRRALIETYLTGS